MQIGIADGGFWKLRVGFMLGECKSFDDVESDKQLWMRHCGRTLRSSSLLELTTHEVSQFLQQSGVVRSFASKNVAIYIYIYTILGCKKPCRCHHGQICCVCAQKPHRDCCTHHYKQQVEGKSWCWMHITDTLPSFSRSCSCNQLRISSFGSWLRIRATASWGPGTFKKRCKHNLNAGCATFAPGLWRTTVILAILVHHWN